MKKITFKITIVYIFILPLAVADIWTPDPKFSVENSNYTETLTFISGISYALNYSNKKLASEGKINFYCMKTDIDSKIIIDLLNKELNGDYSSEKIIETIIRQLSTNFPCISARSLD